MVNDHSDSERGNLLPPHRLLFPISSKGYFYMHHPTDRIAHTTAFVSPVVEHWLEREIHITRSVVMINKLLHIITIKTEIIINYIYSLQSQSLLKVFSVIPHFTRVLKNICTCKHINLQMIHVLCTNVTGSIEYTWTGLDCSTEVIGVSVISPQGDCVTTRAM